MGETARNPGAIRRAILIRHPDAHPRRGRFRHPPPWCRAMATTSNSFAAAPVAGTTSRFVPCNRSPVSSRSIGTGSPASTQPVSGSGLLMGLRTAGAIPSVARDTCSGLWLPVGSRVVQQLDVRSVYPGWCSYGRCGEQHPWCCVLRRCVGETPALCLATAGARVHRRAVSQAARNRSNRSAR